MDPIHIKIQTRKAPPANPKIRQTLIQPGGSTKLIVLHRRAVKVTLNGIFLPHNNPLEPTRNNPKIFV